MSKMSSSECSRMLTCVSRESQIPSWRGVMSVVAMVVLHLLISMEQQAIPAFMPAEIRCNQTSCLGESNVSSELSCGCLNLTVVQEGALLGSMTGAACLLTPLIFLCIAPATSHVFVLVFGGLVWSGMVVFTSYSDVFWKMVVARLGVGIGVCVCIPAMFSLPSMLFQSSTTVHVVRKVFQITSIIGTSFGYLLVLRTHLICWQLVFAVLGVMGFVVSMATMLVVREPNKNQGQYIYRDEVTIGELVEELVQAKPFVVLCFAVILKCISSYALAAWLATYYSHALDLLPHDYGLKLGMVVLCGAGGGALIGCLITYKYIGQSKAVPALLVFLGLIASTGCLVPALIVDSPDLSFALLFLFYVTGEIWWDTALAVSKACFSSRLRDMAITICLTSGVIIGSVAGPLIVAGLSHVYHSDDCNVIATPLLHITSACSGLAAFLFLIVSWLLRLRSHGPSLEETMYLMYDTSDVDAMSERSYSEKNSTF